VAIHAVVTPDWSEQKQDRHVLPQTVRAGDVNLGALAIRALISTDLGDSHDITTQAMPPNKPGAMPHNRALVDARRNVSRLKADYLIDLESAL
jgi:hypothetical protein